MVNKEKDGQAALANYRVLDLTDEKGFLCGKILADLGADVIKIERGGGGRAEGCDSIYWPSYNVNKRGMTIDLESHAGKSTFRKLVRTAHFVVESAEPGYLSKLGLGYHALKKINPALVMVSITPFGQDGPYSRYKGSDLVCWAMGGMVYVTGDEGRAPIRVSSPQAYAVAGANAAVGALIAHYQRERTGQGQYVDISIQACIPWVAQTAPDYWPCFQGILRRAGDSFTIPSEVCAKGLRRRLVWPCRDGFICAYLIAGGPAQRMNAALGKWMKEEGIVVKEIDEFSWDYFDLRRVPQEFIDRIEACLQRFFMKYRKEELFEQGQKRGVMVYPVSRISELLQNPQLRARDFWVQVGDPNHDGFMTYPGAWAKMSQTPCKVVCSVPRQGEHNTEILRDLKNSPKDVAEGYRKKEAGVRQPFEGLLVVDFSWAVAAPIVTKLLAEHGATVIKVESPRPEYMDIVRTTPPYMDDEPDIDRSGLFLRLCPNKLGTAIDMSHPKGREIVRRLVAKADIVVENFRSKVLERWGLDYKEIVETKPDIIVLSSTNLGQTGPYSWMAGFGNLLTGYTGFYHLTGWDDRGPVPLPGAYTDYVSPLFATAALIAALDYRRKTGKGQHIDISQVECGLQLLAPAILSYTLNGKEPERMGNRSLRVCPHGVFRCKGEDRWCAIAVHDGGEWESFKRALGDPPWTGDDKFKTLARRKKNEDRLESLIEEYTIEHTDREVMELLQSHGVPAGMVQSSKDLFEDPQFRFRGLYKELDHPKVGRHFTLKEPFILSKTPSDLHRAAPCLGQDKELVCKEIIGLSDDEFDRLMAEGVLG